MASRFNYAKTVRHDPPGAYAVWLVSCCAASMACATFVWPAIFASMVA